MSILIDEKTRVITQGITGEYGRRHTLLSVEYGTNVVGGVTPGKGGTEVEGLPVFDTVEEAVEKTGADASMIFVGARFAPDAILEAAAAGIKVIACITEGIPALEEARVMAYLRGKDVRLVGPNTPGVISPGKCRLGIAPGYIHKQGTVGVISRSGTLTYEAVWQLSAVGLGQSTCLGLGGDPIPGTGFIDALELFEKDGQTEAVLMIGEIGGSAEEEAAVWIKENSSKPVAAFIAGKTAPAGKRMGHAGAIIAGGKGTAAEKIAALEECGIAVAPTPGEMGRTLAGVYKN